MICFDRLTIFLTIIGGDTHITTNRQPPIEMKLEDELFGKTNLETQFQLSTPPRTLRYQDTVPIFAEPIQKLDQVLTESLQTPNQSIDESFMRRNKPNESTIVYVLIMIEDFDFLTLNEFLK